MSLYLYSLIPFSSIFSAQDINKLLPLSTKYSTDYIRKNKYRIKEVNIMKLADYITFLKKYKVGKRLYFFISIKYFYIEIKRRFYFD